MEIASLLYIIGYEPQGAEYKGPGHAAYCSDGEGLLAALPPRCVTPCTSGLIFFANERQETPPARPPQQVPRLSPGGRERSSCATVSSVRPVAPARLVSAVGAVM